MAPTTDATPLIHLSPAQVLQDEHRMKRLKAALCDGIFAYADEQVATRILDDCLQVCGGSAETLSAVLQTKFFVQHTPFYLIIANRPQDKPGAPPLLVRLLSVCDELNQGTQEDIVQVLYGKYESDLYLTIKPKLTGVPTHDAFYMSSYFQDTSDQPVISIQLGDTANSITLAFCIPKFFDRLAVDGEFWFDFPHTHLKAFFRARAYLEQASESDDPTRLCCKFEVTADPAEDPGEATHVQFIVRLDFLASTSNGGNLHLEAGQYNHHYGIQPESLPISLSTGMTLEELFRRLGPSSADGRRLKGTLHLSSSSPRSRYGY